MFCNDFVTPILNLLYKSIKSHHMLSVCNYIIDYFNSVLFSELGVLSNLPYLISLDASHNELVDVLDFNPPFSLRVCFKFS